MPYVDPKDANNRLTDSLVEIKRRNGDGLWRELISASPRGRTVLHCWPPGTAQSAHYHPDTEEIFVIPEGFAEFDFGDGQIMKGEPGAIFYAPVGQRHSLSAVGDGPLIMMCFLAPNIPDDEVDCSS